MAQTKAKSPSFNIKDRKKVGHLVNEVVLGKGDYVCLSCGNGFNSYLELVTHKKKCSETNSGMMGAVRRLSDKPKEAKVPPLEHTDELSKYITGKFITFFFNIIMKHGFGVFYKIPK